MKQVEKKSFSKRILKSVLYVTGLLLAALVIDICFQALPGLVFKARVRVVKYRLQQADRQYMELRRKYGCVVWDVKDAETMKKIQRKRQKLYDSYVALLASRGLLGNPNVIFSNSDRGL